MKTISKNLGCEFVGSFLRPCACVLDSAQEQDVNVSAILESIKQAGYELISEGTMKEETLAAVARNEDIKMMQECMGALVLVPIHRLEAKEWNH